jgi:tetratricopeptide (TPR) repeat protein
LLLRLLGQPELAETQLQDAVARDPELAHAWYDLGELLLAQGDQTQALAAFEKSAALTETHPNGWAGPMRLAELSGIAGDAQGFDAHLKEALRRGFAFRTVAYDPRWSAFLADPELGAVMARLMSVYGESELLEGWQDSLR